MVGGNEVQTPSNFNALIERTANPPGQHWTVDINKDSRFDFRRSLGIPASPLIFGLDNLPRNNRDILRPERTVGAKVSYSPLSEPAQMPWEAAIPGGLMALGAASYVGGGFLRKSSNKYVHGAGVFLQGTGMTEFSLGTMGCLPNQVAETAPVATEIPGLTALPSPNASIETKIPIPPTEVLSGVSGEYPGQVAVDGLVPSYYDVFTSVPDVAISNWAAFRTMADYQILALARGGWIRADGTAEQKYADAAARKLQFRGYTAENGEGAAFVVFDSTKNKFFIPVIDGQPELDLMISNEYMNTHDPSDPSLSFMWVNGTELKFQSRWPIIINNSSAWYNVDRQLEMIVAPTAEATVEAPTVVLKSFDPTKSPGAWVGSEYVLDPSIVANFSPQEQELLKSCLKDGDHCSKEAKAFYDQVWGQGAANLTGDPSFATPLPEATVELRSEVSRRFGEYLDAVWRLGNSPGNSHQENAPLPFAYLAANLGDPNSFPLYNTNAPVGNEAEGYDRTFGPLLGTGAGENINGLTQQELDEKFAARRELAHNQDRDTIYGEPFLIAYPFNASMRGDLMAIFQIAGTPPSVAEHLATRAYNSDGKAKDAITRVQYQDQVIQEGDISCMIMPSQISEFCGPGYILHAALLSPWNDSQNTVPTSPAKMLELMNMDLFDRPKRVFLSANFGLGEFKNPIVNGAKVINRIETPSLPQEFFQ